MKTTRREAGFLFLEAALLGMLVVVMAAFVAVPRHAAGILRMEDCRTTALFLAEQELTELELRARDGGLGDGSYGGLGPAEDLAERQTADEVAGSARKDGARGCALTARVTWQEGGSPKELRLERWVARHDLP